MLAILAVVGVMIASYVAIRWFSKTVVGQQLYTWGFLAPAVISTYFLTAQRLRDLNISGWVAILWIPIGFADDFAGHTLSPIVLLLLSLIAGTKGPNNYGPDPVGNSD